MGIMHSHINFSKELLFFIKEGKNEEAKGILNNSDLYHSADASGATLLHYATRYGNECLTQFLIEKDCHIDAQDKFGNTPLMNAVEGNHEGVIKVLLSSKANAFLLNSEKKSVLHMLMKCTSHRLIFYMCQLFLDEMQRNKLSIEKTAERLINAGFQVYLATYSLDYRIIEYMLKRGYPVNYKHPLSKSTALHVAVYFYELDCVKTLLKSGADAQALDSENVSPLHHLYEIYDKEYPHMVRILKALLTAGVSLMFCSAKGYFAVGHTLIHGDSEAIRAVLKANLSLTAKDKIYDRTFLHYLAKNKNRGVAEELSKLNIWYDVNAVDKIGLSPLYFAAVGGNVDMIRVLLDKGADPNSGQYRPLYYAYTKSKRKFQDQYNQCIELLLQHGADPNFYLVKDSGEIITMFDAALTKNDLDGLNPIIAELSIREKYGPKSIDDEIRRKITDNPSFNEYFDKCRQLIAEEIFGSITLYKLLTSDYSIMDRYLNNTKLLQKLELFYIKHDVKSCYSYIYNKWEKRYLETKEYKQIKHNVTEAICKILADSVDGDNCIVHNIIKYLDIRSLRQLAVL